jgi:HTH-type transcriptional regulator / antitoxin MqsA
MVARTRQCGHCGARAMKRFTGRSFTVSYGDARSVVSGLSGWKCGECAQIVFDRASAKRYAGAGDQLVLTERRREQNEIRRVREKLGLTQREAAQLTGGGVNAFSRYERGEVRPMRAVVNLFRLLNKHPEMLEELRVRRSGGG